MGGCCMNKIDPETLNTQLSSEDSRKIVINSPVVKNRIGKELEIVDEASYTVLDSIFEYEVLDLHEDDENDKSSEQLKSVNGKGILKQMTVKSYGSGGSSAGSSKKVSFCRTTTFFEKKSRRMLQSQTLS